MTDAPSPLLLPRGLIILVSLWFFGSWLITIGLAPPVDPTSKSYEPGIQMLLTCLGIGLCVAWPLLRLSQEPLPSPARHSLLDLAVLACLLQVVLWPIRLVTRWSLDRTAAIDATMLAWLLSIAMALALATGPRAGVRRRAFAMLLCLAICLVAPTVRLFLHSGETGAGLLDMASPLAAVHHLAQGGHTPVGRETWVAVLLPPALSSLLMAGLLMLCTMNDAREGARA